MAGHSPRACPSQAARRAGITRVVVLFELMLALFLLVTALCWYGAFRWRRRRLYELAARVPGTPELPLVGHAHKVSGNSEVMTDPVDTQFILKTCLEKDDLHRFMRTIIGYGGVFAPVSIWRRRRKIMVPTFSPRILEQFVEIFAEQSDVLSRRLAAQSDGAPLSAWPLISAYTLDSVCDMNLYERKSFLDLLIKQSGGTKGYSNIELREEVMTLIVAGTDTTALVLGFTLTLLAKYPDIQERIYRELCDVFGKSERQLEKEDLPKLIYTERVIKESLRLFPPGPFVARKIEEETILPSGRTLPAGAGVIVSLWGVLRDPSHWGPDADHFDPDRFLPERFGQQHACSYIPFSSGPRNCVGYQYAMMSLKTALATVLRRCRVVGEPEKGPVPQIDVKMEIMMKPVNDFQLQFAKRV
ncbi:Cytochrome P450 4C1 [Eumeta japonica]|uniref:Cytochrome P450 4C1 n=1 Tax=Eumeta variegata TaxID=151549 RepID=A0A4C1V267_EUMVA|nr:Cytochrome P450 4C1 [Eumeta japonica]